MNTAAEALELSEDQKSFLEEVIEANEPTDEELDAAYQKYLWTMDSFELCREAA